MADEDWDSEELKTAPVLGPRANPELVGHETAEAALLGAYRSGRLPHAWLIIGPRGIGKATLAFRFARFLLAEAPDLLAAPGQSLALPSNHPAFRKVASGGHPDLLVVERGLDRRGRLRSEIVVPDARAIAQFLRLTPAEGGWRVVIVDGADAMNRHASNAILKILEEPPPRAVLLLVSDNPGRMLPTVRSRCRRLPLRPLSQDQVEAALHQRRPELTPSEGTALARLSEGSIGRAMELAAAGGLELYHALGGLLARLPELDAQALLELADRVSRIGAESAFALVGELLPHWLARMVRLASGGGGAEVVPGEAAAMRRLAARRGLDRWAELGADIGQLFAEADFLNLDRKQVVLNAFFTLEAAARSA